MADSFFLDIQQDRIAGVVLDGDSKISRVKQHCLVSVTDGNLEEAFDSLLNRLQLTVSECVVGLSGASFTFRTLQLPFQDKKKIEQVLPGEFAEHFAIDTKEHHFGFTITPLDKSAAEVTVALIKEQSYRFLIDMLSERGLYPTFVGVRSCVFAEHLVRNEGVDEFLILDFESSHPSLVIVQENRIVAMRSLMGDDPAQLLIQTLRAHGCSSFLRKDFPCFLCGVDKNQPEDFDHIISKLPFAFTLYSPSDAPLLKIESQDQPWQPALMDGALSLALLGPDIKRTMNLQRGVFRGKTTNLQIKKLAGLIAVPFTFILGVTLLFAWWTHSSLVQEKEELKTAIVAEFKQTRPDITRIVDPLHQLKVIVGEEKNRYQRGGVEGSARKVEVLAELSRRIHSGIPVTVTRLIIEKDKVKLKGETESYNVVDEIKRALGKATLFKDVEISSANLDSKSQQVRFELNMVMR